MDLDGEYMRIEYLPDRKGDLSLFVDYRSRPKSESIDSLETQPEIDLGRIPRIESTLDIGKPIDVKPVDAKPNNKRVRFKKTRMAKRLSAKPKVGNVDLCRVHATHDEYLNYISQAR